MELLGLQLTHLAQQATGFPLWKRGIEGDFRPVILNFPPFFGKVGGTPLFF